MHSLVRRTSAHEPVEACRRTREQVDALSQAGTIDWLGDENLFEELRPAVMRAVDWIDRYGDRDGDGLFEAASHSADRSRRARRLGLTRVSIRLAGVERQLEISRITHLWIPVIDWQVGQALSPLVRIALRQSHIQQQH